MMLELEVGGEHFFSNFKILAEEGFYKVTGIPGTKKGKTDEEEESVPDSELFDRLQKLKKGDLVLVEDFEIREGRRRRQSGITPDP